LDISERAVRYRQNALEDKGYNFSRDSDGIWYQDPSTDDVDEEELAEGYQEQGEEERESSFEPEEPQRVNTYEKAQITKDVHNELTEIEQDIKQALNEAKPNLSSVPEHSSSTSTLVMPHSDSHVGAIVRGRRDVNYYSVEEAKDNIIEYFDKCISAARQRGDVEDVVLIFNGDHLDGEGIYASQRHEQEDNLRNQQRKAGKLYIEQILRLSEEFDNVSVYCVPGNTEVLIKAVQRMLI